MTTAAETAVNEKEARKEALKARAEDMAAREKLLNESKKGFGTRAFLGMTRGKNPQEIQYENWDESQPDSLPTSYAECLKVMQDRGIAEKDIEPQMVKRFILGDNDLLYAEASDPVAEFVDATWDDDVKKQFRLVVSNYSKATGVSIEDAVALIKPGIVASQKKTE